MKIIFFFLVIALAGCNTPGNRNDTIINSDTIKPAVATQINESTKANEPDSALKIYSNKRFKEVTVSKVEPDKFIITGKAQIFEASFNWVIEDGHEELQKGHAMTDAGAPEWGKFNLTIEAKKKRENSTLHLILFESSAKDGSRQYELPIVLF